MVRRFHGIGALCAGFALTAGFALADGNGAWLDQRGFGPMPGQNNSARIDQTDGNTNRAGSATRAMVQVGRDNALTVVQAGDGNTVGLGDSPLAGVPGLAQISGSAGGASNTALITQHTDRNSLGVLVQTAADLSAPLSGNSLVITQGKAGWTAATDNRIDAVVQTRADARHGNSAAIEQRGGGNAIDAVIQTASGGAAATGANRIDLLQLGLGNGGRALGGFAAASGAAGGVYRQGPVVPDAANHDNHQVIAITGDGNQTGTVQQGTGNRMGSADPGDELRIWGGGNDLGAYQDGQDNRLTVNVISGWRNDIGTRQTGVANRIKIVTEYEGADNALWLEQDGTDNEARATVDGHRNTITLFQTGSANTSLFSILGSDNLIDGEQNGTSNRAEITQTGNSNSATFTQVGGFNTVVVKQ